jgi:hypothetical protein
VPGTCPIAFYRFRPIPSIAPLHLLVREVAELAVNILLTRIASVQIDHRGPLAVMTDTVHQLSHRRRALPPACSGVAEVVRIGLPTVQNKVPDHDERTLRFVS